MFNTYRNVSLLAKIGTKSDTISTLSYFLATEIETMTHHYRDDCMRLACGKCVVGCYSRKDLENISNSFNRSVGLDQSTVARTAR